MSSLGVCISSLKELEMMVKISKIGESDVRVCKAYVVRMMMRGWYIKCKRSTV